MSFKVAASDFDGTLYRDEKISAADLAAIKLWRSNGNKFGIVTGRCRLMIAPLFEELGLKLDFLICDNGAIIYDDDGQIIFETELPKKILFDIMNEPCTQNTYHFAFQTAHEIFCTYVREGSWLINESAMWNFPLQKINAAQLQTLQKINQFVLGFETIDEAQIATDALNKKFGEQIFAQRNLSSLDIVTAGINKAQGVENLLRVMNWQDAKIFVIGDEANDLPMIKKFGGCTVTTAKDFVKGQAAAVVESVGAMLNAQ